MTPKLTAADRNALERMERRVRELRDDVESRGYKSSEWQFYYSIACKDVMTSSRLNRLIELGSVEERPDDGHKSQVRVKPKS